MTLRKANTWGYLIIWEFRVHPRMKKRFLQAYGPGGEWAKLFSRDKHYIRTDLMQSSRLPGTYLTFDFWTSQEAYKDFRKAHAAEYKVIDENCKDLTETEREVGTYLRAG